MRPKRHKETDGHAIGLRVFFCKRRQRAALCAMEACVNAWMDVWLKEGTKGGRTKGRDEGMKEARKG